MSFQFSTAQAFVRYHKLEGFVVGISKCRACGFRYWLVTQPWADPTTLKCPACLAHDNVFVQDKTPAIP